MPALLDHIHSDTPMGANLIADGATFRVWAPGYFVGSVGGKEATFSRTFSVRPWRRRETISTSRCFKQELMCEFASSCVLCFPRL